MPNVLVSRAKIHGKLAKTGTNVETLLKPGSLNETRTNLGIF